MIGHEAFRVRKYKKLDKATICMKFCFNDKCKPVPPVSYVFEKPTEF